MKAVKRKYELSPVEFYRRQLEEIINYKYKILTHTDITLMAYIKVYSKDYEINLMRDRIFTNPLSIKNTVSKLKKGGFILKEGDSYILNTKILLQDEDFVQMTTFVRNDSLTEVYHKYYQK